MLKLLFLPILIFVHQSIASVPQKPINSKCPFSDRAIDQNQLLQFGVCCSNCLKKAAGDIESFLKKTKPNNKICSFSAKPARKKFMIGFCCAKCKKKAS